TETIGNRRTHEGTFEPPFVNVGSRKKYAPGRVLCPVTILKQIWNILSAAHSKEAYGSWSGRGRASGVTITSKLREPSREISHCGTLEREASVSWTLWSEFRREGAEQADPAVGPISRRSVARCDVVVVRLAWCREGSDRPGNHQDQPSRSLLHAVHPQPGGGG